MFGKPAFFMRLLTFLDGNVIAKTAQPLSLLREVCQQRCRAEAQSGAFDGMVGWQAIAQGD